jgi:repressor LexA
VNRLRAGDPPTARQADVLRLIAASVRDRGFAPALRELGDAMGLISTNGVSQHVDALVQKGLLTRAPMLSRSLVLTESGRAFIEASTGAAAEGT